MASMIDAAGVAAAADGVAASPCSIVGVTLIKADSSDGMSEAALCAIAADCRATADESVVRGGSVKGVSRVAAADEAA